MNFVEEVTGGILVASYFRLSIFINSISAVEVAWWQIGAGQT